VSVTPACDVGAISRVALHAVGKAAGENGNRSETSKDTAFRTRCPTENSNSRCGCQTRCGGFKKNESNRRPRRDAQDIERRVAIDEQFEEATRRLDNARRSVQALAAILGANW
jgi:hypothetical protein